MARMNLVPRFSLLPAERPWLGLVLCLLESGRLLTNDLGEGHIKCEICLCRALSTCRWKVQPWNCIPDLVLKVMTSQNITLAKSFDSEIVPNFSMLIYRGCLNTCRGNCGFTTCAVKNNLFSGIHIDQNALDLNYHFYVVEATLENRCTCCMCFLDYHYSRALVCPNGVGFAVHWFGPITSSRCQANLQCKFNIEGFSLQFKHCSRRLARTQGFDSSISIVSTIVVELANVHVSCSCGPLWSLCERDKIERQRTPPSELILFWRHVTRRNQGLSLSLAPQGLVGENPGDKVGQEHFWIMKGFPISLRWRIMMLKQNGQWLNEIAETLFLYYMYTKVFR